MNTTELSERYVREYDSLILDFQKEKIEAVVNDLNASIKEGNMIETNILYNTLMVWNTRVSNLSGAGLALNTQFKHLHLPSPSHYSVIFDDEEKVWKFNI